jgi:hypothetical protein
MRVPNLVLAFCVYTAAFSNDNNASQEEKSADEATIQQHNSIESDNKASRELYESTADKFADNLFTSSNIRKLTKFKKQDKKPNKKPNKKEVCAFKFYRFITTELTYVVSCPLTLHRRNKSSMRTKFPRTKWTAERSASVTAVKLHSIFTELAMKELLIRVTT